MARYGYSEQEIDEAVLESQHRRHAERMADPSWAMVEDEWSGVLGGGVWRDERAERMAAARARVLSEVMG